MADWQLNQLFQSEKWYSVTVLSLNCHSAVQTQTQAQMEPVAYRMLVLRNFIVFVGIDIDPLLIERCRTHTKQPSFLTYQTADVMSAAHRREILEGFVSNLGSKRLH